MKKGQIVLVGFSNQELTEDPIYFMKKSGFDVPDYAINCVACVRPDKGLIRIMFFEDADDMLTSYTKFLLFRRRPDVVISYYSRINSSAPWVKSFAPTLVSAHIETRMR